MGTKPRSQVRTMRMRLHRTLNRWCAGGHWWVNGSLLSVQWAHLPLVLGTIRTEQVRYHLNPTCCQSQLSHAPYRA